MRNVHFHSVKYTSSQLFWCHYNQNECRTPKAIVIKLSFAHRIITMVTHKCGCYRIVGFRFYTIQIFALHKYMLNCTSAHTYTRARMHTASFEMSSWQSSSQSKWNPLVFLAFRDFLRNFLYINDIHAWLSVRLEVSIPIWHHVFSTFLPGVYLFLFSLILSLNCFCNCTHSHNCTHIIIVADLFLISKSIVFHHFYKSKKKNKKNKPFMIYTF